MFEYKDEKEYKKLEFEIKKHDMMLYNKLCLECYPLLKEGEFLGKLISINQKNDNKNYELKISKDNLFRKTDESIKLIYTVQENKKIILLERIELDDLLIRK